MIDPPFRYWVLFAPFRPSSYHVSDTSHGAEKFSDTLPADTERRLLCTTGTVTDIRRELRQLRAAHTKENA